MYYRNPTNTTKAGQVIRLIAAGLVLPLSASAQTPTELLAEADRYGDRSNWIAAGPLYARAEAEFHKVGDLHQEIYARLGRLHRDLEAGSYTTVRAQVVKELETPTVQSDPHLKIRALSLLGNIDMNINTAAAVEDWKQVLATATEAKDQKWQNRAKGQLGLAAGLNGDIGAAGLALYTAIMKAEQLGDVAGHVYFATWLANGMAVKGMADRAIPVLDRAIEVAQKAGHGEMPLQLSIAKIRALTLLPEPKAAEGRNEAQKLLATTLAQAERDHVVGAETDLLNQAGEMAFETQDLTTAEKSYRQSADIAEAANLPRIQSDALLHLSKIYRARNEPTKASVAISQAIQTTQRAEQGYDLPVFLAEEAEVRANLGSLHTADLLYDRASNLIEGLLVNAPTSQVKSGMIGAMSDIYVGHFRLAWTRLHDGPKAFRIIEDARARTLFDSIRYARQSGPNTRETDTDREIARLQRTLLHERLSAAQTRHALDQLDDAYDRMVPVEYAHERKEMQLLRRPPVTLAALQNRLGAEDTFIEYVLDKKTSYALEATRTRFTVHPLSGRTEIGQLARTFVGAIRKEGDYKPSAASTLPRVNTTCYCGTSRIAHRRARRILASRPVWRTVGRQGHLSRSTGSTLRSAVRKRLLCTEGRSAVTGRDETLPWRSVQRARGIGRQVFAGPDRDF